MNGFRWFAFAIFAVSLAIGCRGKQSMASKSAARYRDAVAKGIPVAAGGHGQDMKNMPGMQHGKAANAVSQPATTGSDAKKDLHGSHDQHGGHQ